MLRRLAIVLSQVKWGFPSENFLNYICQIIYSLHWEKKVTKNVCDNIMNSIKL